jgi:hypothetical protein
MIDVVFSAQLALAARMVTAIARTIAKINSGLCGLNSSLWG